MTRGLSLQSRIWESAKVTVIPPERLIVSFIWLKLVQIPGTFWLFCQKTRRKNTCLLKQAGGRGATDIKQLPVVFTVMKARLCHMAELSYEASSSKNRKWSQTKKFGILIRIFRVSRSATRCSCGTNSKISNDQETHCISCIIVVIYAVFCSQTHKRMWMTSVQYIRV